MKNDTEANSEQISTIFDWNVQMPEAVLEPAMADKKAGVETTAIARIETAADELFRLRAQSAYVNERVRNLAAILQLATVVIGPSAERSEVVLHGLIRAKQICDKVIAVTD